MRRTRIKICGVTTVDDAVLAARAGADAVGMLLHPPARRNVVPDMARQIVRALPPFVTPVGLFVDRDPEDMEDLARFVGLRVVQLHGHEAPETVAALRHLTVVKAVRVSRETFGSVMQIWKAAIAVHEVHNLAGFVLETATQQPGGTGIENDWATIRDAKAAGVFDDMPPFIAAGGLRPEIVGDVVRSIRPFAVDVSSGVEGDQYGQKSAEKVEQFIQAVRQADADA